MASLSDIVVNPVCLWLGMQTIRTSPKTNLLLRSETATGQSA